MMLTFILLGICCSSNIISAFTKVHFTTIIPILDKINSLNQIVLASASPRRNELLRLMGLEKFHIKVSNFGENLNKDSFDSAASYCLCTAIAKGEDVLSSLVNPLAGTCIIAADTIVECDGVIFEKPKDEEDAYLTLSQLRGRQHYVHTGVALFTNGPPDNNCKSLSLKDSFVETTTVNFVDFSDDDIRAYIKTKEPMDKAGAYGIQGIGGQMVESINGCYFNVMGLPISKLSLKLAELYLNGNI